MLEDGLVEAPVLIHTKQEEGELIEEAGEQNNTAVLATLAALAEATGPLNADNATSTTAAETLQWLETHGITMISSSDNSTIVSSSLESGQNLILTEAGKMALNFVKQQGEEGEVEESEGQMITIVNDPNQDTSQSIAVSLAHDGEELVAEEEDDEPSMKRIKTEDSMPSDCIEAETITMAMEPHMITKEELVEEQVVLAEDLHTHLEAHEELVQEEQYIEEEEVVS
ncbi:hypothetical protein CAPTEDRAFT_190414 [Capitella teleta]|uniref:Uncharacterized protein n=1 Tax=Capitella teleta TaxID=283909 RepID=R7T7I1_CAPTE|nr:hypothetical protein CAPTEDRAFT_190414 [Capitella teleta]|eukprot:ELT89609.1 hypothetical protein CAPTEDRAFT_190414 [Capitella teleta]